MSRCLSTRVVFAPIQERQHHERVGLEPDALADRLGSLHELFRLPLVTQIQLDGREAIVAGKEQRWLLGFLGKGERFLVVGSLMRQDVGGS